MAYSSRNGRKPMERASKISHSEIINNPVVASFLINCKLPEPAEKHDLTPFTFPVNRTDGGGIAAVVALDGGYTETFVKEGFPSASVTFYNFGPLMFQLEDLRKIDADDFIDPRDFAKLKQLQRHSLVLPTKNVCLGGCDSLVISIRQTLRDFFEKKDADGQRLVDAVRWLVCHEWSGRPQPWVLARCPHYPDCNGVDIIFNSGGPDEVPCPLCGRPVWLTDTFRLHEAVDEEHGAGGILGYLIVLLEQMLLVQWIRAIHEIKPSLMGEVLFVKDGPLAFFGQTANLHKPMRALMRYLLEPNEVGASIRLVGVEKSGAFVEHAAAIQGLLEKGTLLMPSNSYIYKYIVPGTATTLEYGRSTYYGSKVIFKDWDGAVYVLTLPTAEYKPAPMATDFVDLANVLSTVGSLKCHMYENALIPVALVNKLVSLSDFPSSQLLGAFAKQAIRNGGSIRLEQ